MSEPNGCSVPHFLRILIPPETVAQSEVCNAHDIAYAKGGDRRARAVADAKLLLGLLECDMDVDLAHHYHTAVRIFGGSRFADREPKTFGYAVREIGIETQ